MPCTGALLAVLQATIKVNGRYLSNAFIISQAHIGSGTYANLKKGLHIKLRDFYSVFQLYLPELMKEENKELLWQFSRSLLQALKEDHFNCQSADSL